LSDYYKLTPLIVLLIILFYAINFIGTSAGGQIEVSSEEELIELLKARYQNATEYQLYLSGRTIVTPVEQVPFLVGKDPSEICILANTNGEWRELPFTLTNGEEIRVQRGNRVYVVRHVPENITNDTMLLIQMPTDKPEYIDPLKSVPPQARGAKEWYWIGIGTIETSETYPILVAMDSPQIREMCGTTAKLYAESLGFAGELKGDGVPWIIQRAIFDKNIKITIEGLKDILKPKLGMVNIDINVNYGPPRNILPDGGGGGEPGSRYIVMTTVPKQIVSSNGYTVPQDVLFELSDGEEKYYSLKINSPYYTKINEQDLSVSKLVIVVYGKINDPNAFGSATVDIVLYPGTQYQQVKTTTIWTVFGYGEYGILIFTPPSTSPYEFPLNPPGEIPFKIRLSTDSNMEWSISLKINVIMKLDNYSEYLNQDIEGSFKYQFADCAQEPCSNIEYQYPVKIVLPAGSSESNITLHLGTPVDIAIVESIPSYYDNIELGILYKVKVPPGYPGGSIYTELAGLNSCTHSLSANPGSNYDVVEVYCTYIVGKNELLDFFVKPYGLLSIKITSTSSNHPFLVFDIYPSSDEIELVNLPYIKIPYSSSEYFVTPVVGFNIVNDNYLAKPIIREIHEVNKHGVLNNLNRWLDIRWTLGSHTYMLINFAISPTDAFNDNNTYDAGNIESFALNVSWMGKGSCVDPMIEVKAVVAGSNSYGDVDWDELFNWVNTISSWLNTKNRIIGILSRSLSVVNLVLDYKDLTEITVGEGCTGSGVPGGRAQAYVRVSGDEAGWSPSEIEDSVDVYINNYVFDESLCVVVDSFSLYIETEAGYVSYDNEHVGIKFCSLGSLYGESS